SIRPKRRRRAPPSGALVPSRELFHSPGARCAKQLGRRGRPTARGPPPEFSQTLGRLLSSQAAVADQRETKNLTVLGFRGAPVLGRPYAEPPHDVLIEIAHSERRHGPLICKVSNEVNRSIEGVCGHSAFASPALSAPTMPKGAKYTASTKARPSQSSQRSGWNRAGKSGRRASAAARESAP